MEVFWIIGIKPILMSFHEPVLLKECIEGLKIKQDGVYVDLTYGGGGHTKVILEKIGKGRVFSFDVDADAKNNADQLKNPSFTFIQANFRYAQKYLKFYKIQQINGMMADLGVSSYQIDTPEKGFSSRYDAPLDMRMDPEIEITAAQVLNQFDEKELHKIFGMYGEVRNAKTLARDVVAYRAKGQITTTSEFIGFLNKYARKGRESKYYAQVFQALRIVVNDELGALEDMLKMSVNILRPGGRLAIISYHSLEDRMVKKFMNTGKKSGLLEKDVYGNIQRPFDPVNRKPLTPSSQEVSQNKRARSAKLRIAQRN